MGPEVDAPADRKYSCWLGGAILSLIEKEILVAPPKGHAHIHTHTHTNTDTEFWVHEGQKVLFSKDILL